MATTYLYVDTSELDALCKDMAGCVTTENFDRLMRRTLNEVGKRSKEPIKEGVQTEYDAPARWIQSAVYPARVGGGGGSLQCVIPLKGSRGSGARRKSGSIFNAGGKTSKGYISKGSHRRVWIRDVKGVNSVLPYHMEAYGGQPPFINGGNFIVTRAGKERGPLRFVVGLALPQMPLNRAADETSEKILKVAEKRLIHNFKHMFG